MNTISAVIITLNEARIIEKTLKSLDFCDEIIIVDSGSTDDTLNIAKRYTDKIFIREFDTYGRQKNVGISHTKNSWILTVDADEVLSNELIEEIKNLELYNIEYSAYKIQRMNYFLGKKMSFGSFKNDFVIRLIDKRKCKWNDDVVHEKMIVNGSIGNLKNSILHFTVLDIESALQKQIKYGESNAVKDYNNGKRYSTFHHLIKPYIKFIEIYIAKLGFLDGKAGLQWATIQCIAMQRRMQMLRKIS